MRHYLRHRGLMAYCGGMFGGRILEVRRESLVTDPEARRVLEYCGLPGNANVLGERTHGGMVATASTIQGREPIHQCYLGSGAFAGAI